MKNPRRSEEPSAPSAPSLLSQASIHDDDVDYAEEGRKLLARVNVHHDGESSTSKTRYSLADLIYRDPMTGAGLYVGNYRVAESISKLDSNCENCRRIVFCQDRDGKKHFESNPEFKYLTFSIGKWRNVPNIRTESDVTYDFFKPLFEFLDDELNKKGNSVLIHCLAGAHRAGTAGIASLMYLTGMDAKQATKTAQTLRPIISPIGDFPILLSLLETAMEKKTKEKRKGGH